MSETKKRFLLTKWAPDFDRLADLRETIDARDEEIERLGQTLETVKYWLHDGLVHHRLVSDPRQLLRKVEDVLG